MPETPEHENARREVFDKLKHIAGTLDRAAQTIYQYAARVAAADVGDPDQGGGHEFIVAQALNVVGHVHNSGPFAAAFSAAARADRKI